MLQLVNVDCVVEKGENPNHQREEIVLALAFLVALVELVYVVGVVQVGCQDAAGLLTRNILVCVLVLEVVSLIVILILR